MQFNNYKRKIYFISPGTSLCYEYLIILLKRSEISTPCVNTLLCKKLLYMPPR
jgi:hypothetical protein